MERRLRREGERGERVKVPTRRVLPRARGGLACPWGSTEGAAVNLFPLPGPKLLRGLESFVSWRILLSPFSMSNLGSRCLRCGAPVESARDSQLPFCQRCSVEETGEPSPTTKQSPFRWTAWLAVGLLPVLTPTLLVRIESNHFNFNSTLLLVLSALCCGVGGFGLVSHTAMNRFETVVVGLCTSLGLAFICLVAGVFGGCAMEAIRF